ncbi:MAG: HNH endonuclease, partial [Acidimicrobiales bacterium]|nr:HNH endonuclease [Acidimicrobiales bacterium]
MHAVRSARAHCPTQRWGVSPPISRSTIWPGWSPHSTTTRPRRVSDGGRRRRRPVHRRGGPRHLHGHHIEHWARGGSTDLQNLVLLCPHHHRLVH